VEFSSAPGKQEKQHSIPEKENKQIDDRRFTK